jgi:hypothetical protein
MIESFLAAKLIWSFWILSIPAVIAIIYSWQTKRGYCAWDPYFMWPLAGSIFSAIGALATIWRIAFEAAPQHLLLALSLNALSLCICGYSLNKHLTASE